MVALEPAVWFGGWAHAGEQWWPLLRVGDTALPWGAAPPQPTTTMSSVWRSADDGGSGEIQQPERGRGAWTKGIPVAAVLTCCSLGGYSSGHAMGIQWEKRWEVPTRCHGLLRGCRPWPRSRPISPRSDFAKLSPPEFSPAVRSA